MTGSYLESVNYLYSLARHGIKLGLESTNAMLMRLGKPHQRYATLHIGGTNGKGSSAAMVASVLQGSGYRVGLYTSPHLVHFRERIRVQGNGIENERMVDLTERLRATAGSTLSLTFFEFTTCMAFQYFAEEQVDVAVIEVGMGGRFDATNVVDPMGVLITNVAFDHEKYLGHTLPAIAFEKAGIIKKGVPIVLGPMSAEAEQVVRSCAEIQQAVCYRFNSDFQVSQQTSHHFRYDGLCRTYSSLMCALVGDHQVTNAAGALALLEVGILAGLHVSESAVRTGLSTVVWEGRLETIAEDPLLLADGAHNPAAADMLAAYLLRVLQSRLEARLILVVGMMRDKNHAAFLERLVPLADHLILTQTSFLRSASVRDLQRALPTSTASVHLIPNPIDALEAAREFATSNDLICITGSLILVGEVISSLLGRDCASFRV